MDADIAAADLFKGWAHGGADLRRCVSGRRAPAATASSGRAEREGEAKTLFSCHAGLDPASTFLNTARVERDPAVYLMASGFNGTLYTGVTPDLLGRVYQHREGRVKGFTSRYGVKRLVWFEMHGSMESAITREKQLKNWRREWKAKLIVEQNPTWRDLAEDFGFDPLVKKVDAGSSPA